MEKGVERVGAGGRALEWPRRVALVAKKPKGKKKCSIS